MYNSAPQIPSKTLPSPFSSNCQTQVPRRSSQFSYGSWASYSEILQNVLQAAASYCIWLGELCFTMAGCKTRSCVSNCPGMGTYDDGDQLKFWNKKFYQDTAILIWLDTGSHGAYSVYSYNSWLLWLIPLQIQRCPLLQNVKPRHGDSQSKTHHPSLTYTSSWNE